MAQMLARVRLAKVDGTPGRVLPHLEVRASIQAYQVAELTVVTTEKLPDECPMILEVSSGDGWHSPRNGLFLMQKSSTDGADVTDSRTYTGVPMFHALAQRAVTFPIPAGPGHSSAGERVFSNPGAAVRTIIDESREKGWGPYVQVDFDGVHDSDGQPWERSQVWAKVWATLAELLDSIVSDGRARWWTEGTTLKMSQSMAGRQLTESVKLRAAQSRPEEIETDIATDVVLVWDGGSTVIPNPGATTSLGRRWAVLTLAEVKSETEAVKSAQAYLEQLRAPLRQVGYRYDGVVDFLPFRDFEVGDTVLARVGDTWEPRVVQAVTLASGVDDVEVEIAVGDRIVPFNTKLAKKIGQLALGSISGGSFALPSTTPGVSVTPSEPQNLRVVSNKGQWVDGVPLSTVVLEWDEVTSANDGYALSISQYEVIIGIGGERVPNPTVTLTIPSRETREVKVRAGTDRGAWGAPSEVLSITGAMPALSNTAPSAPIVTPGMGGVAWRWDGLSASGSPMPAGYSSLIVEAAVPATGSWSAQGAPLSIATSGSVSAKAGTSVAIRFRAIDALGRTMGTSSTKTATALGVPIGDMDASVQKAIKSSLDEYVVSGSQTVPPGAGAAWSSDTPDWTPGEFVWRRTKNTHLDDTVTYSAPSVITGADGTPGEDAVLLRVSSSRGTSFKNNAISTVLTVTVFKGAQQITNITALHAAFGSSAFIEWWWRRADDTDFGVISSADPRLSQAGFALTVSPADVDEQTVFQAILNT